MKKAIAIALALISFAAYAAYAEFSASNYSTFVQRLANLAGQMQSTRDECARMVAIWNTESVSSDADFVAYPSGCTEGTDCELTKTEMTNLITACNDIELFWENSAVTTSNRQIWLDPFSNSSLLR